MLDIEFQGVLGTGAFGAVYRCQLKGHEKPLAAKTIPTMGETIEESISKLQAIKKEVDIMQKLDHRYILKILHTQQFPTYYCIVTPLAKGNLLQRIHASPRLDEFDIPDIAGQILHGLAHMHSRGIIHKDIKPANILYRTDYEIVICDFGLAANYPAKEMDDLDTAGSFPYMSPEMLQGEAFNETLDSWSAGVVIYNMVMIDFPYKGTTQEEVLQSIMEDEVYYPPTMEPELKDLLQGLLQKDPLQRLTSRQAVTHPYFEWFVTPELRDELIIIDEAPATMDEQTEQAPTTNDIPQPGSSLVDNPPLAQHRDVAQPVESNQPTRANLEDAPVENGSVEGMTACDVLDRLVTWQGRAQQQGLSTQEGEDVEQDASSIGAYASCSRLDSPQSSKSLSEALQVAMEAEGKTAAIAKQKIAAADHAQAMLQHYAIVAGQAALEKEEAVTAAYAAKEKLSAMKDKLVEIDRLDLLESCTVHIDAAAQGSETADHPFGEDPVGPGAGKGEEETSPGQEAAAYSAAAEVRTAQEAAQAVSQPQGEEDSQTFPGMESAIGIASEDEVALEAGASDLQLRAEDGMETYPGLESAFSTVDEETALEAEAVDLQLRGEDMATYPGLESAQCIPTSEEVGVEENDGDSQLGDEEDMETYPGLESLHCTSANPESALQALSGSQLMDPKSLATYPGLESVHCLAAEEEAAEEDQSSGGNTSSSSAEGGPSSADRSEQSNSGAVQDQHAIPTAGGELPPPAINRPLEAVIEAATPLTFSSGLAAGFWDDFEVDSDGIFITPKPRLVVGQEQKTGDNEKLRASERPRSLVRGDSAFKAPESLQPKQAEAGKLGTIWPAFVQTWRRWMPLT